VSVPKELAERNLLSTGQVAKQLSVHRSTVHHWIQTGMLKHHKVKSHYGVRPKDVVKLLSIYNLPNIDASALPSLASEWEPA